ncbi:FAD-dependent monooxygenase [Rhizobium sp. RU36D]|uniref:FAD-dependent monooxygenase n=1 Tax=Rhizobium sp. RU36D TaxID=1907415 RepID=UPI0009D80EEA|nr:FAD-dependent monooxygenase [Rhizobium sp. RU36D]SMD20112.1 2-polyprenyl-6-methoxyphenol hydroxylase [Rhizobium sp. RU36D]
MAVIKTALIVGGGIAGMSAAIALRKIGVDVHLIDVDPHWRVAGAGITITGPTLRVMAELDILPDVLAEGFTADGILACDHHGHELARIDTSMRAASGVPGAGGIMRPVLHAIMTRRLKALSPRVSLGISIASMTQGDVAEVTFTDGTSGVYDLVVGADGIYSQMRKLLMPEVSLPRYVGQMCWRLTAERLPDIDRRTYFLGGPSKVGLNPVAPDAMYMFLLEPSAEPLRREPAEELERLAELMAPFGGAIATLRDRLDSTAQINVRPLETLFLDQSWLQGRTVLIGDAAHATTPQLASGAGMAMEDGVVLAQCLDDETDFAAALHRFMERRLPRCRLVVDKSLALGRMERSSGSPVDQIKVVESALAELNGPI